VDAGELIKLAKASGLDTISDLSKKQIWQIRWTEKNRPSRKHKVSKKMSAKRQMSVKKSRISTANHNGISKRYGGNGKDLAAKFVPIIIEMGAVRAEIIFKATLEKMRAVGGMKLDA
jgi:hypothetical protein